MYQLLETIKIEDGYPCNLEFHNRRFNQSRRELFGITKKIMLDEFIQVPNDCSKGTFRCRVVYREGIEKIEFSPYQYRRFKSLKIVYDDQIEYSHKFADREKLNSLLNQKGENDEIIIIKNGIVTDCTIGNLVFFDGETWYTPSSPLLNGTQRMKLIESKQIKEKRIHIDEITNYSHVGIINAFYDLGNMSKIPLGFCY